jgi:RNA polymerase sigma-70 factor (ECF subfamily)
MDTEHLEFREIYDTFQPRILRYLTRMLGSQEAEDLTQEVFVKVNQALESYRGEAQLSTWIYRIATNAALDRQRSASFRQAIQEAFPQSCTDTTELESADQDVWTGQKPPSVELQIVREEMDECIANFIKELPESYRTVLVLSELEGLRNNEIADILGVTLGTVKIRLHRAKEKLKEKLSTGCEFYWVENNEFVPNLRKTSEKPRKTS